MKRSVHRVLGAVIAVGVTLLLFLVLPVIQAIAESKDDVIVLEDQTVAALDEPEPPVIEEPEPEPEPEEPPPELEEEIQPLDLAQLELALDPGISAGLLGGDFGVRLDAIGEIAKSASEAGGGIGLDQDPRLIHQVHPSFNPKVRKRLPGTVVAIFIVDEQGRVQNPKILQSSDPVFERPALAALKQWKFEPGRSGGRPVEKPMRIPIKFPED